MLEQATLIFEVELFLNLVFLLKQKLTNLAALNKSLYPVVLLLRIICNVITFPNIQIIAPPLNP